MHAGRSLVLGGLVLAAVSVRGADVAATLPDVTLSPQVQAAIQQLSSESFEERQKALATVQQALAAQLKALVRVEDPEAQARMAALLEFNEGMSHWARDTLSLPREQREAQLKWGLKAEVYPILGKVYASRNETRAAGARELAKLPDPEASWLLARLLNDDSRLVYVAAMEAVYDRPPTKPIIEALWDRAVEYGLAAQRGGMIPNGRQVNVFFRGRDLGADMDNSMVWRRNQDSSIAAEVLIHLQPAELSAKCIDLVARMIRESNNPQFMWLYMPSNSEPIKNAYRIMEAVKPRAVVPELLKLAAVKSPQRNAMRFGNQNVFATGRTPTLALIAQILGQDLSEYKLKKNRQMGDIWTVPTEQDEDDAAARLQKWWQDNGAKFLAGAKDLPPPATAPATRPAEDEDEPADEPARGGAILVPGRIQRVPAVPQ